MLNMWRVVSKVSESPYLSLRGWEGREGGKSKTKPTSNARKSEVPRAHCQGCLAAPFRQELVRLHGTELWQPSLEKAREPGNP